MATKSRTWDFQHPRKVFLQELLSAAHSLEDAASAVAYLQKVVQRGAKVREIKDHSQSLVEMSMYWFAVMSYMRCFTTGRHSRIDINAVAMVTKAQRDLHGTLRDVRNKYIAHPTGDRFEGGSILLHGPAGSDRPTSFMSLHAKLSGETHGTLAVFARLINRVLDYVHHKIDEAGDEIARHYFGEKATWKSSGGWTRSGRRTSPNVQPNPLVQTYVRWTVSKR